MRSQSSWVAGFLAAIAFQGCVLEDGDPWGLARAQLAIAFQPEAGRLIEGRLVTAKDYRVEVDSFELELGAMSLLAGTGAALGFDPASPPEGYTLCHNGHCHTDDGRVVSYDEIARELAGEGVDAAVLARWSPEAGAHDVALGSRGEVPLGGCEGRGCAIEAPTATGVASLEVNNVRIAGRVFDARTGASARLPEEGVEFTVSAGSIGVAQAIAARFGPSERLGLELAATLSVPAGLFDEVDFAAGEGLDAKVAEALASGLRLELDAKRFD